jgi:hypothetical protein
MWQHCGRGFLVPWNELTRSGPFALLATRRDCGANAMKGCAVLALLAPALLATPGPARANDYPTPVVADYVIGCMASNGETQEMLQRCSCSIDAVSSIMPYDSYEKAETVLRMQLATGDQAGIFREMTMLKTMVDTLRLAQIEADFRCF